MKRIKVMNKKNYITYFIAKTVLFTILAILVLVFREKFVEYLPVFIGALMVLYGVEGILLDLLFHRHHFFNEGKTYLSFIELLFGIVLLCAKLQFEYVCIIWATWTIVRESYEIREVIVEIKSITPKLISGIESAVVIVLSVTLLLEPGEHHAMIHTYLLVVELILSPLCVLIDELIINYKNKKKLEQNKTPMA